MADKTDTPSTFIPSNVLYKTITTPPAASDPYANWVDEFYGTSGPPPQYGYDFGYDRVPVDPTTLEGYGVNETGASTGIEKFGNILQSLFGGKGLFDSPLANRLAQMGAFGGLAGLLNKLAGSSPQGPVGYQGGIPQMTYTRQQTPMSEQRPAGYRPGQGGISYFTPGRYTEAGTAGGISTLPVAPAPVVPETATPTQRIPERTLEPMEGLATGGYMPGGITMLATGGFMPNGVPGGGPVALAGGRYLRGPGDGVSDSIPAKFERSGQPARLADGEFVIDARTVSELGNGSSEAGARKLYEMMDRVHKARKTAKRGKPSGADQTLNKLA